VLRVLALALCCTTAHCMQPSHCLCACACACTCTPLQLSCDVPSRAVLLPRQEPRKTSEQTDGSVQLILAIPCANLIVSCDGHHGLTNSRDVCTARPCTRSCAPHSSHRCLRSSKQFGPTSRCCTISMWISFRATLPPILSSRHSTHTQSGGSWETTANQSRCVPRLALEIVTHEHTCARTHDRIRRLANARHARTHAHFHATARDMMSCSCALTACRA
jgi:hypothetical protein